MKSKKVKKILLIALTCVAISASVSAEAAMKSQITIESKNKYEQLKISESRVYGEYPTGDYKKIMLLPSVSKVEKFCFEDNLNIEEVEWMASVDTVPVFAFSTCPKLKRVILSDNVKKIGQSAFIYCGELTSVKLPQNLQSIDFFAFADLLKKQEKSEYQSWYHITRFPVREEADCYECFFGFAGMPKLNTGNEKVQEYLLNVLEYWVREVQVDGYRFDVIDEIDENFVLKIRDRLKRLNPELVLIGETWAEGKRLLNGCEMDSIMNYSFRQAMLDFFAERSINAETFGHRLETALSRHPDETNMAMFNALDTHDTKRFINSCSHRLDSFKLGVVVQMMFPGSPSIYYGDEAGIDGENDPDCRKCMTWQENPGEKESFRFYQRLIQFRKKHSAIRNGSFTTVLADGRVYGFARENETEIIEIFVNDSDDTVEITVENARSILISKGNFYIVCRKNGEIIEEICS